MYLEGLGFRSIGRVKKTTVGYGLLLLDLQDGSSRLCESRGTETGMRLYDKLSSTDVDFYCTDHCKYHKEILESEFHIRSKAETYSVEGYNNRGRRYLARFKRKGKRYNKAEHMIQKSLKILFLKLNNELYIRI